MKNVHPNPVKVTQSKHKHILISTITFCQWKKGFSSQFLDTCCEKTGPKAFEPGSSYFEVLKTPW